MIISATCISNYCATIYKLGAYLKTKEMTIVGVYTAEVEIFDNNYNFGILS